MGKISIIHAPESREFSCTVAAALAAEGHAVQRLEPGGPSTAGAPSSADAVIVVWSPLLGESPAMIDEARHALARRVLVPIALGDMEPPGSFAHLWPIDLAGWKGDTDDPRWQFVRDEISLAARRNEPAMATTSSDVALAPGSRKSAPALTPAPAAPRPMRAKLLIRFVLPGAAAVALMTGAALWLAELAGDAPAAQTSAAETADASSEPVLRQRLDQPTADAAAAERLEPPQETPTPARAVSLAALASEQEAPAQEDDPAGALADAQAAAEPEPLSANTDVPPFTEEETSPETTPSRSETAVEHDAPSPPPLPAPQEDAFAGLVFRDCLDCPDMVEIPAGVLEIVGSGGDAHPIAIDRPFAISRREITFKEWEACVAGGGCRAYRPGDNGWGRDRRPAINVSFEDAQAYADWLSAATGRRYRLPTEAEWEYAAGGRDVVPNELTPMRANYDAGPGGARAMTTPTASFSSSVFGLYDVFGNVWEWTADCDRAAGGEGCAARVLKGGAFDSPPEDLRASARTLRPDNARAPDSGFRVVRETP